MTTRYLVSPWCALLLAALAVAGCSSNHPPTPPPPPPQLHAVAATVFDTRGAAVGDAHVKLAQGGPVFEGDTDAGGYVVWGNVPVTAPSEWRVWVTASNCAAYSELAPLGSVNQTIRIGDTRAEPQDLALPALSCTPPPPPFYGPVLANGKFFVNSLGTFRPLFASALTALVPGKPVEPFLDWAVQKGFNGVRVFAGALTWAGVTPEQARAALPHLLDLARQRSLYVEVVCLTDTATGYDIAAHVRAIGDIVRGRDNVLVELANEPWHPTQKDLTPARLLQLRALIPSDILVALGSAEDDESQDYSGGDYTTIHLNRDRDLWNMIRRVREMQVVVDATGRPASNDEPIGAAEAAAGQRLDTSAPFLCLGALSRIFEVGVTFHFEDGLNVTFPVGPKQEAAATAFVDGFHAADVDGGARLTYKNATWSDSPIQSFDESRATRVYAGVFGNLGRAVVDGGNDAGIVWQGGWHPVDVLIEQPGCRIYAIER